MEEKIRKLLTEHMEKLRAGERGVKDVKQYVFEIAMESVFGSDVWTEIEELAP